MKKSSHILMGKLLLDYTQSQCGVALNKRSFLLGNVLPDYLPTFLSRPHFLKNCEAHVQKLIEKLLDRYPTEDARERARKRYSRRLGMLCHFYTDFFCYAHSARFSGGLRLHRAYELGLREFFLQHFEALQARPMEVSTNPASDIRAQFEDLQAAYLGAPGEYLHDIAYGFFACVQLIAAICGARAAAGPA